MWSSIETAERIGLVLAQELPSAYRTLCYKEIWVQHDDSVARVNWRQLILVRVTVILHRAATLCQTESGSVPGR